MREIDSDSLSDWIGRQETRDDVITAAPVAGLSATLDYDRPLASEGEPLPPLWHWLYCLPTAAASDIDVDGHPRKGGFLPPVPLPRRMWAGSDIRFHADLQVGEAIRRISTIDDLQFKRGGSGELVFVKVRHEVFCAGALALEEYQDLVYRPAANYRVAAPRPAPRSAVWHRQIRPDSVLLFRFSALTFNAHRIHYDRDYSRDEEGYPGVVVQGPLTAILLLDLLRREMPAARLASFRFRGARPLFGDEPIQLQGTMNGDEVTLWALDADGALAMEAQATLAHPA